MILDTIRSKYPHLGIAVFAMEAGQPVTVETYLGDEVFSFTGPTVEAALARAFPDLAHPTCPNTGLPCVPGCDRKSCAGLHAPLNQWPMPDDETIDPGDLAETEPVEPAASVFD